MRPDAILRELRRLAAKLPETTETVGWGHPTFKAGKKAFAVLDHYRDVDCLCVQAGREARARCLRDARFFEPPYDRSKTWLALPLEEVGGAAEVRALALGSYRFVALARMLRALEGAAAAPSRAPRRTPRRRGASPG